MRVLRALTVISLVTGTVLLLCTGLRLWDPFAGLRQNALANQLYKQWDQPAQSQKCTGSVPGAHPARGRPFAMIRIPKFGPSWKFAIVEGASLAQLSGGPGHVTGTQFPGQMGNFAVAAHDITAGNPFLHLGELRAGDMIIITTKCAVYRYSVQAKNVVRYTDVGVLDPVPGHRRALPRRQLITLITCTPVTLAFTPYRIIVSGYLLSVSEVSHASTAGAGTVPAGAPGERVIAQ